MMSSMWMGGVLRDSLEHSNELAEVRQNAQGQARAVKELERHIGRLSLLNQALWELLRERLNLTDAELQAKVNEIDLRDGVQDGAITSGPLQCPKCGRISNSRYAKCLYCGLEFEKPAMT